MGINRVTKRGKTRIEVRKRWPDGTTFRRFFPNMTLAIMLKVWPLVQRSAWFLRLADWLPWRTTAACRAAPDVSIAAIRSVLVSAVRTTHHPHDGETMRRAWNPSLPNENLPSAICVTDVHDDSPRFLLCEWMRGLSSSRSRCISVPYATPPTLAVKSSHRLRAGLTTTTDMG